MCNNQQGIPQELKEPNYYVCEIGGLGYDPEWERQDPSNVIKVGGIYHAWYSKFRPGGVNWGYDGTIFHAVSPDGWHWKEIDEAVGKGADGAWDSYGVITPYVVPWDGKYYLFYTGTRDEKPFKLRGTKRNIGIAVAESPDGPWLKLDSNPVFSPGAKDEWDSLTVDDVHIIVRDGKFWLYYKGCTPETTAFDTKWGLAISDCVTGPYVKHPGNPVLGSGHCTCLWPHRDGIAALVDNAGPEKFTIQYSRDGIHFERTASIDHVDIGCAPYDPDAFTNTKNARGISWGLAARRKNDIMYIIRFQIECEVGVKYPDRIAVAKTRSVRATLLADRHRPIYHIVTPEGICDPFDPNGAIFWKGRYHLMYIIQNDKGHSWAHISSKDLIHWRHHPPALEPGGCDNGIFSGGAFIDKNGVPTISYWGIDHRNGKNVGICIATSTDDNLDSWTKSQHNPVIRETENGITVTPDGTVFGAADPSAIWIHDGRYHMLTGNLLVLHKYGLHMKMEEHQGDTACLFTSDDMITWKYEGPFYKSERRWTNADEDNMCPDFFPLGDRHVLMFISHNHGCQYYIGRYEQNKFLPESHGRMSWEDRGFFAPESLLDDKGRRIMWAWLFDWRRKEERIAAGWSGMMSLPRVLKLGEDRMLRIAPPEELNSLRYNHRSIKSQTIKTGMELPLNEVKGDALELSLEISSCNASKFGVLVRRSPDSAERTAIYYDSAENKIKIDTRNSSLGIEGLKSVEGGPLKLRNGEKLRFRVFLDKSVVEVFADDSQAVTRVIYPTRPDSIGVALFSEGGETELVKLDAWDMAPANPW